MNIDTESIAIIGFSIVIAAKILILAGFMYKNEEKESNVVISEEALQ
jgi:hypothetical protein